MLRSMVFHCGLLPGCLPCLHLNKPVSWEHWASVLLCDVNLFNIITLNPISLFLEYPNISSSHEIWFDEHMQTLFQIWQLLEMIKSQTNLKVFRCCNFKRFPNKWWPFNPAIVFILVSVISFQRFKFLCVAWLSVEPKKKIWWYLLSEWI